MSTPHQPLVTGRRGSAIVFDPVTQTMSTEKYTRLEMTRATSKQSLPKWSSHVDLYVDCDDETKRLVATLNLEKLGWAANMKRLCGKISDIYVMELPDIKTPQIAGAA